MTDTATPRLALPLIAPGQAQKEMYHNEALTLLDMAVQGSVAGIGLDSPPSEPPLGACWIVGNEPNGAWEGQAKAIAGWTEGGWRFLQPREGCRLWIGEDEGFALFSSGLWNTGRVHGRVFVEGRQVVGAQSDPIAEPDGGTTVDAEARAAIGAILAAMREHGLVATSEV